jgi:CspA family cold shock protein
MASVTGKIGASLAKDSDSSRRAMARSISSIRQIADSPFDALREGQSVSFDVGQGPKGPRAENVKVA